MNSTGKDRMKIGVIGSGIAGMSAAWLLSKKHDVFLYEKDDRVGGHANTVSAHGTDIDTGFIVYNEKNYPNLIALFDHLDVETKETDMSFGVSMNGGRLEYTGTDVFGMFAQKRNLLRPSFWLLIKDILRFYKESAEVINSEKFQGFTLRDYLTLNNYSESFIQDHLLPMGAAIWSTPVDTMLDYPLISFINFCDNHGLLQVSDRPKWRTVAGGSHNYVKKLTAPFRQNIKLNKSVTNVWSDKNHAYILDRNGEIDRFDHIVMASHGDQSLDMLPKGFKSERDLLKNFQYQANIAHLHTDENLMPKNKKAWSSWNYLGDSHNGDNSVCVTYWMNKLQHLETKTNYFVTLNPTQMPRDGSIIRSFLYHHPVFDQAAIDAQENLWAIQGKKRVWFCGSYFGYGFHEDALQSGLAVAEELGAVRRPWDVEGESSRIILPDSKVTNKVEAAA